MLTHGPIVTEYCLQRLTNGPIVMEKVRRISMASCPEFSSVVCTARAIEIMAQSGRKWPQLRPQMSHSSMTLSLKFCISKTYWCITCFCWRLQVLFEPRSCEHSPLLFNLSRGFRLSPEGSLRSQFL